MSTTTLPNPVTFYRGEDPLKADKLNEAFAQRLLRTGDTMYGPLMLSRDPLLPFEAATKEYVDGFNQLGPQGPPGEQGIPGPPGAKGDQGNSGPQGNQGVQGNTGTQGPPGQTGAKGDQGVKGDTGGIGPQGNQGIQGIPGPQGNTGAPGTPGTPGIQGPPGPVPEAPTDGQVYVRRGSDTSWQLGVTPVQMNTALSAYLPLTGGTLSGPGNLVVNGTLGSGNLSVTGTVTSTGAMTAAGALTQRSAGNGYTRLTGGDATHTGYLEFFNAAGTRQLYLGYASGNTAILTLEDATTLLQVNAPQVTFSTNVTAVYIRATGSGGFMADNGYYYFANNFNYYMGRRASDGMWVFVNNGSLVTSFSASGDMVLAGTAIINGGNTQCAQFQATNQVIANNRMYPAYNTNSGYLFYGSAPYLYHQYQANWYWYWNGNNGDCNWYNATYGVQWYLRADGWAYNPASVVGGNGAYQNISDERIKQDIEPAPHGLDAIMALKPIRFVRKNRPFATTHETPEDKNAVDLPHPRKRRERVAEVGFSAQQIRQFIPEAVSEIGQELVDGSGGMDSDEPTLSVSLDPIVAALVNAVKTLTARIAVLEGTA